MSERAPHTELVLLRHGATDWNRQGRFQGTRETALSPQGKLEAAGNAALLERFIRQGHLDPNRMALVCSPLKRARQTAEVVAHRLSVGRPVIIDNALRELSMGRWEGLTSLQVKQRYYLERKSRKSDPWGFRPVGGESMEQRSGALQGALAELPPHSVVVTHSVVLRIIFHLLAGTPREVAARENTPHISIWHWNSAKLHRQD